MLKEKVVVKTLDDGKTHTVFDAMWVDVDNDEPVGTVKLRCQYREDYLKYWSNVESVVVVDLSLDDDDHNSFIGRIEKVSLKGFAIFVHLQNAGWKFKNRVPKEFRETLVAGQHVTDTFQAICEGWGLEFCYSIKSLYDYTFSTDGYSVQKDSNTITEVPDEFKILQNQEELSQTAAENANTSGDILSETDSISNGPSDNTSNNSNTEENSDNLIIDTVEDVLSGFVNVLSDIASIDNENSDSTEEQAQDKEDEIKKLEDKYKEDFEEKIHNLIKGDKIYEDSDVVTSTFDYDKITVEPKAVTSTTTPTATNDTDSSASSTNNASGSSGNVSNSNTPTTTNTSNTNSSTNSTNTGASTNTSGNIGSSTGNNGTIYPGSGGQCPTTETISFTGSRSCACSSTCKCTGTVTQSFYNYCPQCTAVGKLENNPKGVGEGEITCGACDADYCICCGGCKASSTSCSDSSIALIPSGSAGSGTQSTGVGSTYIKIPDKSFWGLIKQICGATDSIFTIANNCVYLIQYRDLFNYADKFKTDINTINKDNIARDNIQESWVATGFYNTVVIDDDIKVSYDELVNLYGESAYHYYLDNSTKADGSENDTSKSEDLAENEMTARAKGIALLAQHVRDYGMGLKFTTLYHPGITPGSFVRVDNPIRINKTADEDTINNVDDVKYSDKQRNNDVETKENLEQYFVQGYTIKWNHKRSLRMDVELKYGPDTPEDPVNATITFSGGTTGSSGDTCNLSDYGPCTNGHTHATTIYNMTVNNNTKITPTGSLGTPTADDYCQIGVAGTNYAQAVQNMSMEEVYYHITDTHPYGSFGDTIYADCSEAYAQKCLNCGEMSRLLKCCMDVIQVPCYIIHIPGHYYCGICVNGQWKTMDGTRKNKVKGSTDTNSCNFEASYPSTAGC